MGGFARGYTSPQVGAVYTMAGLLASGLGGQVLAQTSAVPGLSRPRAFAILRFLSPILYPISSASSRGFSHPRQQN